MGYKVLHICSCDYGGAGIAAYRLHKALRASGIESDMLCLDKRQNDKYVHKYTIPLIDRLIGH